MDKPADKNLPDQALVPSTLHNEAYCNQSQEQTEDSVVTDILHQGKLFGEGAFLGSVGSSINGVKQVYDYVRGQEYKPFEFFSNEKEVRESWAGTIGEYAGSTATFLGLGIAGGGGIALAGAKGIRVAVFGGAWAGAAQEGLLTPSDKKYSDNLFKQRVLQAWAGGITGGLSVGSGYLEYLGERKLASMVVQTGIGSAIGLGAVETSASIRNERASLSELRDGAISGALGALTGAFVAPRLLKRGHIEPSRGLPSPIPHNQVGVGGDGWMF